MQRVRSARLLAVTVTALLTMLTAWLASPPRAYAADWAPVDQATIRPGVQMVTEGAQCTANFVYEGGGDVYLGYAAHCAGTGAATDTNGCDASSHPLGTPVDIEGATQPGELAYSSWLTMQQVGETDADACDHNDFALVRIDPADAGAVNPTVPFWGGPVGLDRDGSVAGEQVESYGNSSLRLGLSALSPKTGTSLGDTADGWTHPVYTATPGIPGDSGSGFLDDEGRALGVLSTLQLAPLAGSNGVSDLASALDYAAAHGGPSVTLAEGTEPYHPDGDLGELVR